MSPLHRFHLATGSRLALRAWTPLIGAATVAIGLSPDPAATLAGLAGALAGPSWSPASWILLSALLAAGATWAAPRVTLGARGWIRHLPASRSARVGALWVALAASLAPPVVALFALLALQAPRVGGWSWSALGALPLLALLVAGLVLAAQRPFARAAPHTPGAGGPLPFDLRIGLRALGARIVPAWAAGALPLLAAWLFVRNNALPAPLERRGAVLGSALALAIVTALLAEELAARRPAWPWGRTLPLGSGRRVASDAALLGALALPLAALAAAIDPLAAVLAVTGLPLLTLRASGAMRRGGEARTAAAAPVLPEGAVIATALTLVPAAALLALGLVPLAWRAAARDDRELRVTRWSERHHRADGDSLSWTA